MALNEYGWFLDGHPAGIMTPVSAGKTLTAGKYYFEVTLDDGGIGSDEGWGIVVGFGSSSAILFNTFLANVGIAQANAAQTNLLGAIRGDVSNLSGMGHPVVPVGCSPLTANGQKIGLAINTIAKTIWWRNASTGSIWNLDAAADPATGAGVNIIDFSASGSSPITGSVFVIVGASLGNSGGFGSPYTEKGQGTVNFGASAFTGTAPSGYSSINSAFPGAALNPNDNSNLTLTNGNLTFEATTRTVANQPICCVRSRFSIAV